MVDSNKNLVINEGGLLSMTFPVNHLLIVNDPLMFVPQNDDGDMLPNFFPRSDGNFPVWELLCDGQGNFPGPDGLVLTEENCRASPVFEIEDDDDVIFVGEYTLKKEEKGAEKNAPRRNPVRQARNSKLTKNLDEIIYEDDFRMLDSSEDELSNVLTENLSIDKQSENKETKIRNISLRDLKKWPASGLHERPEYNVETQKIEKFDYTIREIQSKVVPKKATLNAKKIAKPVRKPKKYTTKRKRKMKTVAVEKVKYSELNDLIQENLNEVGGFIKNVRDSFMKKLHRCPEEDKENLNTDGHSSCLKKYKELLMNQSHFYSFLKDVSVDKIFEEISEKFS